MRIRHTLVIPRARLRALFVDYLAQRMLTPPETKQLSIKRGGDLRIKDMIDELVVEWWDEDDTRLDGELDDGEILEESTE